MATYPSSHPAPREHTEPAKPWFAQFALAAIILLGIAVGVFAVTRKPYHTGTS